MDRMQVLREAIETCRSYLGSTNVLERKLMADSEAYLPGKEPFWKDDEFQVHELREGHYVASRINGAVHFRGSLQSCAQWIEKERKLKK